MLHIIGAVEGYSWERTALWHESIRRHCPEAVVHLVAYDLSPVTRAKYERRGIVVHPGVAAGNHVVVRRFGDWADLLSRLAGDVILSDVRDIVFQATDRKFDSTTALSLPKESGTSRGPEREGGLGRPPALAPRGGPPTRRELGVFGGSCRPRDEQTSDRARDARGPSTVPTVGGVL